MTINAYIEKIVEKDPNQIVTIYDKNHNIMYHGKADFAPLTCWDEYKNSYIENRLDIDGNSATDLIINGRVEETTAETIVQATLDKLIDDFNSYSELVALCYSKKSAETLEWNRSSKYKIQEYLDWLARQLGVELEYESGTHTFGFDDWKRELTYVTVKRK